MILSASKLPSIANARVANTRHRLLKATTLAAFVGLSAVNVPFGALGPFGATSAMAQTAAPTVDSIRNDILSGLAAPLPITVVGPLIVQNVNVTELGDGFRVDLDGPLLMGIVPLDAISFTLTPEGDDLRVSDFALPASVPLFGAAVLEIGSSNISGLWSPEARSYTDLRFELGDLQVRSLGGQSMQVDLQRLALSVDQQGSTSSNGRLADNSLLRIETSGVRTQGLPGNDVTLDGLFAELKANGEDPVDLYAIVSRFVLLSAMQRDQSAAIRFLDSLRARDYALLSLEVSGEGLSVAQNSGRDGTLDVTTLGATLALEGATPQSWDNVNFVVEGSGIEDAGFTDRFNTNSVQSASSSLSGSDIPIGKIIEAVGLVMAAEAGVETEVDLGGLLDGLIGFDTIALETAAENISITSRREGAGGLDMAGYTGLIQLEGLGANGQGEGIIAIDQGADGIELRLPPEKDATQAKVQEILLPQAFNYDLTFDGLQLPLLRRLSEGTIIPAGAEPIELIMPLGLWFTTLKPNLRVVDTFFEGAGFGVRTRSDVTFYPSWMLSFPPYEGSATTEIRGVDNLKSLIEIGLQTPAPSPDAEPRERREWRNQQEGLRAAMSAINTMTCMHATLTNTENINIHQQRGNQEEGRQVYRCTSQRDGTCCRCCSRPRNEVGTADTCAPAR
ncbi:MAG: hypothetical protein AAF141_13535 [Pseudomonadota bacterium]